jgi:glutaminyl-peptide cyclotransferase
LQGCLEEKWEMRKKILNSTIMSVLVLGAFLLPLCTITSCGNRPAVEGKESPVQNVLSVAEEAPDLVTLLSPANRDEIAAGRPVNVRISHKGRTLPDSVQIWFGGSLTATLAGDETTALVPSQLTEQTGVKPLKLMAFSGKRRPQVITVFITVLSDVEPARYRYSVEKVLPHDERAYTQGLLYHDGYLFEGTGQEGRSSLRKVEIETGQVVKLHNLESRFFGEGIAILGNKIYQLTWKTKVGFVYDLETFREIAKFYYNTEGWGLTTMGDKLVMSDGSNKLYIVEPSTFATIRTVEVYDNNSMVVNLNELEYIDGEIWANIYLTDLIARIDPATGRVTGYIDLAGLIPGRERRADGDDALNGIAWDKATGRIFVTGKNWPKLFLIKVIRQ